jgi:hypothetical protein
MLNLKQTLAPTPGGWQMRAVPVRSIVRGLQEAVEKVAASEAASEHRAKEARAALGEKTEVKPESGPGRSTLMLLQAESNAHCDVIARCLERVGLRVQAILPARAALLIKSLQLQDATSSTPVVRVHVCEQTMTLFGWANGRLLFARCTDAGYGLLTDALYRGAKSTGTEDDLTQEAASRALFTSGIPISTQVLDIGHNITGADVLPLMQPALQRCIVEIRQTLRFGMSEADLDRSTVIIDGPGATIPGLVDMLSMQLERPLENASSSTATAVAEDTVGDLPIAAGLLDSNDVWIVPECERVKRDDARLGVAVRAGAGVAVAVLALWAGQAYRAGQVAKQQLTALAPRVSEIASAEQVQRDTSRLAQTASQVRALINNGVGDCPDWVGVLSMIAKHDLPGVTMTDISYEPAGDAKTVPTLTIRGRALPPAQANADAETKGEYQRARDGVAQLLQYLDKSEHVAATRILTNRLESGGAGVREFSIAIDLKAFKAMPPEALIVSEGSPSDNLATEPGTSGAGVSDAVVDDLVLPTTGEAP